MVAELGLDSCDAACDGDLSHRVLAKEREGQESSNRRENPHSTFKQGFFFTASMTFYN